jgi:hypothetical protein
MRGIRSGWLPWALVLAWAAGALGLSAVDVYYGDLRHYTKAAEVNARKVFDAIPAYREIVEKNIREDSALYLIKLGEANKVFNKALTGYAEENGYDLVCEEGSILGAADVTGDVVKLITEGVEQEKKQ